MKIKTFLSLQTQPRFKFLIQSITAEDIQVTNRVITKEPYQGNFNAEMILQMYEKKVEPEQTISFTGSKTYFSNQNSLQGILKKEKGVAEHFNFEKSNSHLQKLKLFNSEIDWQQLLLKGYKEFGFSFKKEGATYTGSIDLWGLIEDTCYVIDYKTGDKLDTEMHMNQLKFYAQALSFLKFITQEKVRLVVCYMAHEKVEEQIYELLPADTFFKINN